MTNPLECQMLPVNSVVVSVRPWDKCNVVYKRFSAWHFFGYMSSLSEKIVKAYILIFKRCSKRWVRLFTPERGIGW